MTSSFVLRTLTTFAVFGATAVAAQGEPPPPPTPPAEWTCPAGFFGTDDGCDCGCGALDPDCADATFASCDFNQCDDTAGPASPVAGNPIACAANVCGDSTTAGEETCDDGNANASDGCSATCTVEDGFDCERAPRGTEGERSLNSVCRAIVCGDGSVDGAESCDDTNTAPGDGCDATCTAEEGFSCPTPGQACIAVPAGWTCNPAFYGDQECDCGCGVLDVDCPSPSIDDCGFFDGCGGGTVDPADPTQCIDAPAEGEGEGEPGEGEGEPGEGEGEGGGAEGEGEGEGSGDGAICAAGPAAKAPLFALLGAVALLRRRRR
jgi:MYXO-CTERM domain-containing protein